MDDSLFHLLIADGIQSFHVKHMYIYFITLSFNRIVSKITWHKWTIVSIQRRPINRQK